MSTANKGVQFFEVTEDSDGQRIDNFLLSRLKGVPRSHLYRLIRKGEIRVNKKRIKPETRLLAGDLVRVAPLHVTISAPSSPPGLQLSELIRNSIVFENDSVMVVNKPQGLAVHAGSGVGLGLIEALRHIYPQYPHLELVHRIDKATSGCLLVAKNSLILKHLQREIKAKKMLKSYFALVHGRWPTDLQTVDAPLHKTSVEQGSGVVRVDNDGKSATTHFEVVQRFQAATLVRAMPITGRTHQIRVHCQHAGHAIVGDDKYTARDKNSLSSVRHLCLHAASLEFSLPDSAQRFRVEAPMNAKMRELLLQLEAV